MNSAMQTFYSRLTAGREDHPLFLALRSLSRLETPALFGDDEASTWGAWDPTGDPPDVYMQPAASLA